MSFSTEYQDIKNIQNVLCSYDENKIYRDVYFELHDIMQNNDTYDPIVGLLDKWLWKYGYYTIAQFRNL